MSRDVCRDGSENGIDYERRSRDCEFGMTEIRRRENRDESGDRRRSCDVDCRVHCVGFGGNVRSRLSSGRVEIHCRCDVFGRDGESVRRHSMNRGYVVRHFPVVGSGVFYPVGSRHRVGDFCETGID